MKRKAPLSMMELMVMIAVFALAAALCLQAFVKSDQMSRRVEARDTAAILCQSVAELVQYEKGDLPLALERVTGVEAAQRSGFGYFVSYDSDWKIIEGAGAAAYTLRVMETDSGAQGLGKALVEAFLWSKGEMESLFSIQVSWQKEVTAHD